MKIIAIGDLHGNQNWTKVIEKEKDFDKIIFVGDYLDTKFGYKPIEQKQNLEKLIQYKKDNFNKVILLYGNHDHHYISFSEQYSGFQSSMYFDFNIILKEAIKEKVIKVIHIENNYLFSHAGVSKTWLKNNSIKSINEINDYLIFKPSVFNFQPGANRSNIGNDITQSPIWIRPESIKNNCIDDYIQIVGHTMFNDIEINKKLYFIDSFNISNKYLVINNNKPLIKTLS